MVVGPTLYKCYTNVVCFGAVNLSQPSEDRTEFPRGIHVADVDSTWKFRSVLAGKVGQAHKILRRLTVQWGWHSAEVHPAWPTSRDIRDQARWTREHQSAFPCRCFSVKGVFSHLCSPRMTTHEPAEKHGRKAVLRCVNVKEFTLIHGFLVDNYRKSNVLNNYYAMYVHYLCWLIVVYHSNINTLKCGDGK